MRASRIRKVRPHLALHYGAYRNMHLVLEGSEQRFAGLWNRADKIKGMQFTAGKATTCA